MTGLWVLTVAVCRLYGRDGETGCDGEAWVFLLTGVCFVGRCLKHTRSVISAIPVLAVVYYQCCCRHVYQRSMRQWA